MALGFGGRGVEALSLGAAVEVDPRTGAASLRVPVPVQTGRGLAPSLALVYGSGAGNSAFGAAGAGGAAGGHRRGDAAAAALGWCATGSSWPATSWCRGMRRLAACGRRGRGRAVTGRSPRGVSRRGASKVRIEQWTHRPSGRVHFRTRDPANVVTIYGARAGSDARLADLDDLGPHVRVATGGAGRFARQRAVVRVRGRDARWRGPGAYEHRAPVGVLPPAEDPLRQPVADRGRR